MLGGPKPPKPKQLRQTPEVVAHPIAHRISETDPKTTRRKSTKATSTKTTKTGPRLAAGTTLTGGEVDGAADPPNEPASGPAADPPNGGLGKRTKRQGSGRADNSPKSAANDADLARIVASWPTLPEPIRRAMLALVGLPE